MKKTALGYAAVGGFEMPALRKVDFEKEHNIVFATTPKTVYHGSNFKYSRAQALAAALNDETKPNGIS